MSQPGHRQLEHLPLGRIRQRVLSQFWLGFAGPWDTLTQKRQSASEANPVKVSDDAILPVCLIGFLQVKEETNCPLPLRKGIPEIYFEAHQVVGRVTMFSETTLASVLYPVFFKIPD